MDIKVLPPNLQKSELEFSVAKIEGEECILFGLGAIKGAGEVAINIILEERKNNGEFKDLESAEAFAKKEKAEDSEVTYEIKETSGCFNSYGELLATVIRRG